MKKILILSASPVKDGNTSTLVNWFVEGATSKGAAVDIVATAFLKYKATGCTSCRRCQTIKEYACVIKDEASPVLAKMAEADVIVMASTLVFLSG